MIFEATLKFCFYCNIFFVVSCQNSNNGLLSSDNKQENIETTNNEEISSRTDLGENISSDEMIFTSNRLQTGEKPYKNISLKGSSSAIKVKTEGDSGMDIVVIVKNKERIVRNAYIKAGDSYTFRIPNGTFQVFFYGGVGWNPNKIMGDEYLGGFVKNESFAKDNPVNIKNQMLEYELILQRNGNFSTLSSSESEMF